MQITNIIVHYIFKHFMEYMNIIVHYIFKHFMEYTRMVLKYYNINLQTLSVTKTITSIVNVHVYDNKL